MLKWKDPQDTPQAAALHQGIGGSRLAAEILYQRGFSTSQAALPFIDPDFYTPASPYELNGMETAVARLLKALKRKQQICVWGDFDVDGQTATALLVSTLRMLGGQVTYTIPNRAVESHGVHVASLTRVIQTGAELILTCDTGISSVEAVAAASNLGVDVIVTDHHTLPAQLPEALALVNPQFLHADHPLVNLPGVGVAYKLAEALAEASGQRVLPASMFELAALGIVADLAIQHRDTRYLLQRGLAALRKTTRPGLAALLQLAQIDSPKYLSEEQIGFQIAPRLNAAGRLADARIGVEFLLAEDPRQAAVLANQLEGLNARRKMLTSQVFEAARLMVEAHPEILENPILVLSNPAWPAGIVGIVASQVVGLYQKPAILLTQSEGGGWRGSARSMEGVDITALIASQAGLLLGYGGHPMAAGLSMPAENLDTFTQRLNAAAAALPGVQTATKPMEVNAWVSLESLSLPLVRDLERLAPFGPGNPPVLLASRDLRLASVREIGRQREHLALLLEDPSGFRYPCFWWQASRSDLPEGLFDLAFTARSGSYRGEQEVQLTWQAFRQQAAVVEVTRTAKQAPPAFLDLRQSPDWQTELAQAGFEEVQVWKEGLRSDPVPGRNRYELEPAPVLVFYSLPPSNSVMREILENAAPHTVVFINGDPGLASPQKFLERLAGGVKFAINRQAGRVEFEKLVVLTNQTPEVVQLGLAVLESQGAIRCGFEARMVTIQLGDGAAQPALEWLYQQLQLALAETAAYRKNLQLTSLPGLFGNLFK